MSMTLHDLAQWRQRLRIGDYAKLQSGEYSIITDIRCSPPNVVFSVRYLSRKHGEQRELNRVSIWYFGDPMEPHEIAATKLQGLV